MEFTLYAALPASDIDRAKAWYSEKLGAEPVETGPGGELRYDIGGTRFGLYASAFAGTNQATAAMLAVSDFDTARAELRSRGVVFEDYDFGDDFRTVDGVLEGPNGEKAAWFKDSEGNILGLASSDLA
jgi:catechol 2,3-dioxygenase-like lactoylglutathione lyase family enzyme